MKCLPGAGGYGQQDDCEDTLIDGYSCELNSVECGGDAYTHAGNGCADPNPLYAGDCSDNILHVFLHPEAMEDDQGGFTCPEEDPV